MSEPDKCRHCGEPLDPTVSTVRKHHNGIVFCAFVKAPFDWYSWTTAAPAPAPEPTQ